MLFFCSAHDGGGGAVVDELMLRVLCSGALFPLSALASVSRAAAAQMRRLRARPDFWREYGRALVRTLLRGAAAPANPPSWLLHMCSMDVEATWRAYAVNALRLYFDGDDGGSAAVGVVARRQRGTRVSLRALLKDSGTVFGDCAATAPWYTTAALDAHMWNSAGLLGIPPPPPHDAPLPLLVVMCRTDGIAHSGSLDLARDTWASALQRVWPRRVRCVMFCPTRTAAEQRLCHHRFVFMRAQHPSFSTTPLWQYYAAAAADVITVAVE